MQSNQPLDFEVDELTNSIENTLTGEIFDTVVAPVSLSEKQLIKKANWLFDWQAEFQNQKRQVFKLTTTNNPAIIQGFLSIEDKGDHIFMHLLENARFNRGKDKVYIGVAGNLVAYSCKVSFEKGYEGFVAFDSKTELIKHYEQSLGATHFKGLRMFIETNAALLLVSKYFKTGQL